MIGKLLIAAGFGALLSIVPALAQETQQQGMSSEQTQSDQIYKKKKKMMQPQGQTTGQATGSRQQIEQNQAAGEEGQPAKKKKKLQQMTTEGQQPAGQTGTKKLKKQATGTVTEGQQATGQTGMKTKKRIQQTEQMTTGATGKIATEIPAEKRTMVRQKLVSMNVQRVQRTKIKVNLTIGVRVPRTIKFYPIPLEVVRIVPAYRGYLYFVLDDGTIVIVEPRTYEVVYVMTA